MTSRPDREPVQLDPRIDPANTLLVRRLGLQDYEPVWHRMQAYTEGRDEHTPDEVWLLQHHPVFTLGRNAKPEHLLDAGTTPVVHIDRGGQVTYHGPGQLVVYTLIDLKRRRLGVRKMVSALEQTVIGVLADYGVHAQARPDAPGVYVDGAKVAALGLRVRQGRCYHGLSFNLDMDLTPFARINPCGYAGMQVVQLRDRVAVLDWSEVEQRLLHHLAVQLNHSVLKEVTALPGASV